MTGSTRDLILIAVVTVIALAAWIVLVFYADAHPAWRRPEAPAGRGVQPGDSPARWTAGAQPGRRARTDGGVTAAGKGHRSARRDLPRRKAGCGGRGSGTGRAELTTALR